MVDGRPRNEQPEQSRMHRHVSTSPHKRRRIEIEQEKEEEDLLAQRQDAAFRLASSWKAIADKYTAIAEDEDDEIDLSTGEIVTDNGWTRALSKQHIGGSPSGRPQRCSEVHMPDASSDDSGASADEMGEWEDLSLPQGPTRPPKKPPAAEERSMLLALKSKATQLRNSRKLNPEDTAQAFSCSSRQSSPSLVGLSTASSDFSVDIDNTKLRLPWPAPACLAHPHPRAQAIQDCHSGDSDNDSIVILSGRPVENETRPSRAQSSPVPADDHFAPSSPDLSYHSAASELDEAGRMDPDDHLAHAQGSPNSRTLSKTDSVFDSVRPDSVASSEADDDKGFASEATARFFANLAVFTSSPARSSHGG